MNKKYEWPGVECGSAEYQRLWRLANREHCLDYHRDYDKKMYALHLQRETERRNRYIKQNPEKFKAHQKVYIAVKAGKLFKQPCEVCGIQKVIAHHTDYSKPLDVLWLCQYHHKQWHTNNN